MSDSKNADAVLSTTPAAPALSGRVMVIVVGDGLDAHLERVPAGTPGCGHYTHVRAKLHEALVAQHEAYLSVLRGFHAERSASVPVSGKGKRYSGTK